MSDLFHDLIVRSSENKKWPARLPRLSNKQSILNHYKDEANELLKSGLIKNPILLCWDDWNLSLGEHGGWDTIAPFIFYKEEAKIIFLKMAHIIQSLKGHYPELYMGTSYFIHRYVKHKKTVKFRRSADVKQENSSDEFIVDIELDPPKDIFWPIKCNVALHDVVTRKDCFEQVSCKSDCLDKINEIIISTFSDVKESCQSLVEDVVDKLFGSSIERKNHKGAVLNQLIINSYLFSVSDLVEKVYFIPSHGFISLDGQEECSGGMYIWCGEDTQVKPREIQAYDTYRGLRTSVVDWTEKQKSELKHRARRNARSAIMSRNLSHNMGSHALANARFFDAIGFGDEVTAKGRLGDFNSYLQGRLDFIARATSESSAHPELMYFVRDLVSPFLDQKILLDTLLSDNGYSSKNIEFHIRLPLAREDVILRPADPRKNKQANGEHVTQYGNSDIMAMYDDVMVAVPGGMVGRHAFYAFLENIMRNAAKYGAHAVGVAKNETAAHNKLIVRLELNWSEGCDKAGDFEYTDGYVLTVSENLSEGTAPDKIAQLRKYLDEDIIDDDDKERVQGHGIQEMKVCAEFLAGGENNALRFDSDCEIRKSGSGRKHPLDDYGAYIDEQCQCDTCTLDKTDKHCVQGRHSLACYGKGDGKNDLAYGLLLHRPGLPLEYSGHTFGRRVRATGGVHEQEVCEALVGEAQAGSGPATASRREPGCAESGNRPAGLGTVWLAG